MLRFLAIERILITLRVATHEELPGRDKEHLGLEGLCRDEKVRLRVGREALFWAFMPGGGWTEWWPL